MNNIAIYGAGGLGREVALLIEQINEVTREWNIIGFFDDHIPQGKIIHSLPVLGGVSECSTWASDISVALAIADPAIKEKLYDQLKGNPLLHYPALIHPSSNRGDLVRNEFSKGVIINAFSVFTTGIHVGNFVMVNLGCTIGHDVWIEDYSSIMPGCHISGNVKVGKSGFLGTGSKILQNLSLGDQCIVGAGAVVTKSAHAGTTLVGVPAKEYRK